MIYTMNANRRNTSYLNNKVKKKQKFKAHLAGETTHAGCANGFEEVHVAGELSGDVVGFSREVMTHESDFVACYNGTSTTGREGLHPRGCVLYSSRRLRWSRWGDEIGWEKQDEGRTESENFSDKDNTTD